MDNISNYVYRVFRKEELEEFRKSKLFRETNWILILVLFIYVQTSKLKKQLINILKQNRLYCKI